MNPCNSGLGLGFNPAYPPGGGTLAKHFTGREYVLINASRKKLGAALIGLPRLEVNFASSERSGQPGHRAAGARRSRPISQLNRRSSWLIS